MSKNIDDPKKPSSPIPIGKRDSSANSAVEKSVSPQQPRTDNDVSSNHDGAGIGQNSPGNRDLQLSLPSGSPSSSTSGGFHRPSPVGAIQRLLGRINGETDASNGSSDGLQASSVSFNQTVNVADEQSPGRSSRAWLKPETPISGSSSRTLNNGNDDDERYNLSKYLNRDREPRQPRLPSPRPPSPRPQSPHSSKRIRIIDPEPGPPRSPSPRPQSPHSSKRIRIIDPEPGPPRSPSSRTQSPHSPNRIRLNPSWPQDRKHTDNQDGVPGHIRSGRSSPYKPENDPFLPLNAYKGFGGRSPSPRNKNEQKSGETNSLCVNERASSGGESAERRLSKESEAAARIHESEAATRIQESEAAARIHGSVCEDVCKHMVRPKSPGYIRAPVDVTYDFDVNLEFFGNDKAFVKNMLEKYNCNILALRKAVAESKVLRKVEQEREEIRNRSSSKDSKGAKSREPSSDRAGRKRSISKSRQKRFSSSDSKKDADPEGQNPSTDIKNVNNDDVDTERNAPSRSSMRFRAFKDAVLSKLSSRGRKRSNSISSSSKSTDVEAKSTLSPVDLSIVENERRDISASSSMVQNHVDPTIGQSSANTGDVSGEYPHITISGACSELPPATNSTQNDKKYKLKPSISDLGQSSPTDRKRSSSKGKQKHSSSGDSKKKADSKEPKRSSDSKNVNDSDVENERRQRNRSSGRLQALKDTFVAKFTPKGRGNNKSSSSSLKSSDADPKSTLTPVEVSVVEDEEHGNVLDSSLNGQNSTDATVSQSLSTTRTPIGQLSTSTDTTGGQLSASTFTADGQPSARSDTTVGLSSINQHSSSTVTAFGIVSGSTDLTVGHHPSITVDADQVEYCISRKHSKNSTTSESYITFSPDTELDQNEINDLIQQGLTPSTFDAGQSSTSNERPSSSCDTRHVEVPHRVPRSFSPLVLNPNHQPDVPESSLLQVPDTEQPRAGHSFLLPDNPMHLQVIEPQDLEQLIIIFARRPVKAPTTTFRNNGSGDNVTIVINTSESVSKPEEQIDSNQAESSADVNVEKPDLDNSDHRPSQLDSPEHSTDSVQNRSKN